MSRFDQIIQLDPYRRLYEIVNVLVQSQDDVDTVFRIVSVGYPQRTDISGVHL